MQYKYLIAETGKIHASEPGAMNYICGHRIYWNAEPIEKAAADRLIKIADNLCQRCASILYSRKGE